MAVNEAKLKVLGRLACVDVFLGGYAIHINGGPISDYHDTPEAAWLDAAERLGETDGE